MTYDECHEGLTKGVTKESDHRDAWEVPWWPPGNLSKEMTSELKPEGQEWGKPHKRMRRLRSHITSRVRWSLKLTV